MDAVGSKWVASAETPEGGESEPKQTRGIGERRRQVGRWIRGDKGGGESKARAGGQTRSTRARRRRTTAGRDPLRVPTGEVGLQLRHPGPMAPAHRERPC